MFVGRKKELTQLNECFAKKGVPVVVLYGREGIGKTTLVREFVKDKSCVYYLGRELSKKEQKEHFMKSFFAAGHRIEEGEKVCLVVDEFDVMQKGYKDYFEEFNLLLDDSLFLDKLVVVLVSSNVPWIENQMVDDMGMFASRIVGFIKLKQFSFLEMVNRFPDSSTEECITIYSLLGGVPEYLNLWDVSKSTKENVISLILRRDGLLHKEANRYLKTTLRELPFYNTVLSVLAEDEPKLNYLYNRTEFSRAKISVYIKNLMQLDVTEKYFSYEPKKRDMAVRGLYGISEQYLHFWYKFIYPNLSDFEWLDEEQFYETYIEPNLAKYVQKMFVSVCKEFLSLMNQYQRLPEKFSSMETFYGKEGNLSIISDSEDGKILIGECLWADNPMSNVDFQNLVARTEQLGRDVDYYYLFSKNGFSEELTSMAASMDNIELVDLESL